MSPIFYSGLHYLSKPLYLDNVLSFLQHVNQCTFRGFFFYFLNILLHAISSIVSDSLWPHSLCLARLLCPWDSPGKNSGVGCHFLLWGIFLRDPNNISCVSCITGRFFTSWANQENKYIYISVCIYIYLFGYGCSVAQSCLTPCEPMDCSLPGSSVHGSFQARILEWGVAISYSKGCSQPRNPTRISYHLHWQADSLSWRREWLPTPGFLPGESHGQRNLVDYSLLGCKESDMTEQLNIFLHHITNKYLFLYTWILVLVLLMKFHIFRSSHYGIH